MRSLRFRAFGVPVRIEATFVLVLVILGIVQFEGWLLVSWVVVAALSIVVHEAGHAVAFRSFGHPPSITLQGFGGVTSAEALLTPGRGIVVSLAGPLSALLLLGLPAWVVLVSGNVGGDAEVVLAQVVWVNVGWSVLNLLPILPLDGGHVTRSVIDLVTDGRGERPARVVSAAVAGGLGIWALSSGQPVAGMIGLLFAMTNITEMARARTDGADDTVADAIRCLLARDPRGALVRLDRVLAHPSTSVTRARALDLRAWSLLAMGDQRGAQATLQQLPPDVQPSARTQGALALVEGRRDEGLTLLTYALAHQGNDVEALLIAQFLDGTGMVPDIVAELLVLDSERGSAALAHLASDLRRLGAVEAAASVDRMRAATG